MSKNNFPQDDEFSLQQGCYCDANLDIWYSSQFIQNEETNRDDGKTTTTKFQVERTPILAGCLTGTVRRYKDVWDEKVPRLISTPFLVQTFVFNSNGFATFTSAPSFENDKPSIKATSGSINLVTGEITIEWNEPPGKCDLVISYEYNLETNKPLWESKKVSEAYVEPTFEKFFTTDELAEIAKAAGTVGAWDFNTSLGDTIREKYESLYVKIHEMTNVLLARGAMGYFWICASPEITSIFETVTIGFNPATAEEMGLPTGNMDLRSHRTLGVLPMGLPQPVTYRGAIHQKWRLYSDNQMPKDMVLIGCNDKREDDKHYARLMVYNFVV